MEILHVVLTALLSVAALFVITKIMGHKQVAQLDFFDYVSGITIGSIGAELATELEEPEKPLIALAIYGIVSLCLNFLTQKLRVSRKYVNGTPTILISHDKIHRDNLKKAKLDLSELMLLAREQGYFDLSDIEIAVFEHTGRLSVLPKSTSRPATTADLMLAPKPARVSTVLIMDGQILTENLTRLGLDETWLAKRLATVGYKSERDILLAVYKKEEDKLTAYPME